MTNWPEDIADELPAPRDDEPSSLRQDIADELADHLHSSFMRELHRTPEETSAKQHVLDRFGDPRRVARELWFDAMKEKIMSQRLMLAALVVTAVACLGSTGLSWMLVQQSREANQALLEQAKEARVLNRELLTQNETANSKMLDRLAALAAPATVAAPRSMEWNPVKIRLVKDKAGGPPAEGYTVSLSGHILDTAKQIQIVRKTGANGVADMGLLRAGEHALYITTPWGESHTSSQLTVLPGEDHVENVICPGSDREESPLSFAVDWPDDLRNRGLWSVCLAGLEGRLIDGKHWSPPRRSRYQFFVITADNDLLDVPGNFNFDYHFTPGMDNPFHFVQELVGESLGLFFDSAALSKKWRFRSKNSEPETAPTGSPPYRPYHFQFPDIPAQTAGRWPTGRYTLQNILIADGPKEQAPHGPQKIDVLGGMISHLDRNNGLRQFNAMEHPFADWVVPAMQPGNPEEYRQRANETPSFEIELGKPNQIKIPIKPKLAELVRTFLDASK